MPNLAKGQTPQRMAALVQANNIRFGNARAKEKLRSGEVSVVHALERPAPSLRHLRVRELLLAAPGMGPHKAKLVIERSHVSGEARLGTLGYGERRALLDALERTSPGIWERGGGV